MFLQSRIASALLASILAAVPGASGAAVEFVASFPASGSGGPLSPLIEADDGFLYGTTTNNNGAVVRFSIDGQVMVLHEFTGANGEDPAAPLLQGLDGQFHGTTSQGGPSDRGTVFRMTALGVVTVLHSFGISADGYYPFAGLVQGSDGNFYGTTSAGGTSGRGTVFRISPAGAHTVLASFNGSNGSNPRNGLVEGSDGNFYGTTCDSTAENLGVFFRISPAGALTALHSFTGPDGRCPSSTLVQTGDGNFYGTTRYGGATDRGTVFRVTPAGVVTVLHSFDGAHGRHPDRLTAGADGHLYGTTGPVSSVSVGATLFQVTTAGVHRLLFAFTGGSALGLRPKGVVQGSDGNLYGVNQSGGSTGDGAVYRFVPGAPNPFDFADTSTSQEATTLTSGLITVGGLATDAPISIAGHATASYRINSQPWTMAPGTVAAGDRVRLRMRSGYVGDVHYADVDIGGVEDRWVLRTVLDTTPDAFTFTDVTGATPGAALVSNTITISGLNRPVSIAIAGHATATYRLNSQPFTNAAGTVFNGDTVTLRMVAGPGGTIRNATLTVSSRTDTWTVESAPAP